ncbi:hypothetical protein GLAREA_08500 [Glarea lozoyensis ATCC 20868]|uniref:Transcription factor domain-containing protein n=1 Tax=Glarea lozoyensis (strain ATCC 20868 / MF5171) TaxID=1116229 RepID=S3CDP8_GLAL2|nr:uncharacterized protein GLAREA_08500 [Glarea lozoyensis ATCC 20868]EPE24647.1 hypothetical protein GLAREA_08500 [Glarea lozoyensis ATCC 20868]
MDLQTQAVAYYVNVHLQTSTIAPHVAQGLAECVSFWSAGGDTCPMVDLALTTVSLAVFARIQRHPAAASIASSKYHRLLQLAQLRISSLAEHYVDGSLLTVFLMGRYEALNLPQIRVDSQTSFESLHSWSHHDGAMAVLSMWYETPGRKAASLIIRNTRRDALRSCILRSRRVPDWLTDGEIFGETREEAHCDLLVVRIANLYAETRLLQRERQPQISRVLALSDEARDLDKSLVGWPETLPPSWSYQQHQIPGQEQTPKSHFYSSSVYSYSNHGIGAIWCQYFSTRMFLASIRLKILNLNYPTPSFSLMYELQRLKCTNLINSMSAGLAASIPFCLERFEFSPNACPIGDQDSIIVKADKQVDPSLATLVVWPLGLGGSLPEVDPDYGQWFKSQLAHLGRVTGAGVLECAENQEWATL